MKDTGSGYHGRHLKASLDYIMNPEKTQEGRLIGAVNCQPDKAFEQMKATKQRFGKIDKRQGYHFILSFAEGEGTPDMIYEITQKFVDAYLKERYEAVFVVHDNTEHLHSHIVFNSVSFLDGKKYRYEKGDWAKYIQPITNKLCEEYGLSTIEIEEEERGGKKRSSEHYKEWNEIRDGKFIWSDMIRRDVEACILQSSDFDGFLDMMQSKGYEIKQGKHLSVRPEGMARFRRLDTVSEDYELEQLKRRIALEGLETYRQNSTKEVPHLVTCRIKRYRRAKLSGIQKRYYAKLYRIGQLKKKPYSQVWKYREDIKRMKQLQQEYNFLVDHDIHSSVELTMVISNLTDKKRETSREKGKVYRTRQKYKELFEIAGHMEELEDARAAYLLGDGFFKEENNQWESYQEQLKKQGYQLSEVQELAAYYKEQASQMRMKEAAVTKELRVGESIWKSLADATGEERENTRSEEREKEISRDRKEQPHR